jgi:hypothetical protein
MGLEHNAMVLLRDGGASVRHRAAGTIGNALSYLIGAEKADPISESVSERTCIRIEGAR